MFCLMVLIRIWHELNHQNNLNNDCDCYHDCGEKCWHYMRERKIYSVLMTSSTLIGPLVEHNWGKGLKIHIENSLDVLFQQSCNTEVKILVLRLRQPLWWKADKKNVNSFVLISAQISMIWYDMYDMICMILLVIVCLLTGVNFLKQ